MILRSRLQRLALSVVKLTEQTRCVSRMWRMDYSWKRPLEGNKGLRRWTVISSDAVRRVNVGGVQTLQFLNLDGLLPQRLSTACRCNSSTTRTAERSSKHPVTQNAVWLVEPQLTKHWLNRLCTYLSLIHIWRCRRRLRCRSRWSPYH